jgi:hypothetical protein
LFSNLKRLYSSSYLQQFSLVYGTVLTSLENLSPCRREALKLAPFPAREGGWGLGLTVPRSTENRYIHR